MDKEKTIIEEIINPSPTSITPESKSTSPDTDITSKNKEKQLASKRASYHEHRVKHENIRSKLKTLFENIKDEELLPKDNGVISLKDEQYHLYYNITIYKIKSKSKKVPK